LHKKFGPAQNLLGPVEGQGITVNIIDGYGWCKFKMVCTAIYDVKTGVEVRKLK
jgi:hypothetical protein